MSKTTNKFSPEVRARAVRMILDHEGDYPSRWSAVVSVADKIGCAPQTLQEWEKKAEVDSGKRAGVPTDTSDKLKALGCSDDLNYLSHSMMLASLMKPRKLAASLSYRVAMRRHCLMRAKKPSMPHRCL